LDANDKSNSVNKIKNKLANLDMPKKIRRQNSNLSLKSYLNEKIEIKIEKE